MPTTIFGSVRPGDVISSDLMNYVLTKLVEIDGRVSDLEEGGPSTGGVTITSFDPPIQVAAGQELTVNGTNFLVPAEANTVTIDGFPITSFRTGSTSIRLRFFVPTTLTIPLGGKNVTVRVANVNGDRSVLYRVIPAVTAPGSPPVIENVTPVSGPVIAVNAPIIISGQNFAVDPLQNTIRFRLVVVGGEVVYPLPGQTIQIEASNSNTTQIQATVPNITEIPLGESRNVGLEVSVGAHVPDLRTIAVFRLS